MVDITHRVYRLLRGQVLRVGMAFARRDAGVDLDQLAPVEDLDQLGIGPHLHPLADQLARDRVERLVHLDMAVAVDFRSRIGRQVIGPAGDGEQQTGLLDSEYLGWVQLGGAVHPHPRRARAPLSSPTLRVVEVDELLTGEEIPSHIWNLALHLGLIGRGPHPRRVYDEAPGLGVLHERVGEAGLDCIGLDHDWRHVVWDHHGEDPSEERPRRLEPLDHRLDRLAIGQEHEVVAAVARSEDQRVGHPALARRRIGDQAHAAEVHLTLHPRLAVGDAHC